MNKFFKYGAYTVATLRNIVHYRFAFFTSIMSTLVQLSIMYCIWKAVFINKSSIAGFTEAQMLTYVLVSQLLNSVYELRNAPERMIADRIRTGDLALDLTKPVRFSLARLMENFGGIIVNIIQVLVLFLAVIVLQPAIELSPSAPYAVAFVISSLLSIFIVFELSLITGFFSFWTMSIWGLFYFKKAIIDLLSGALVPISLFPKWAVSLSTWLPFKSIVYTPTMIYMGKYDLHSALQQMLFQAVWIIILWMLTELIYKKAIRSVQINGG
jgi:ABC-2 type transport system permease protein